MQHVQPLKADDLTWIVQELRELPRQSAMFADVPDDVNYVLSYFTIMLHHNQLFGVVHKETRSFLLWTELRPWYADRLEIHEMILWVPSEFRGTRVALFLIEEFTAEALERQPHSIHAGASLDITAADRTLRLYERAGYTISGHGATMRT